MNRIILSTTLSLVTAAPCALRAADMGEAENLNRFSLGARFGMNFKADFQNNSQFSPPNPGLAIGGVNHQYQDGNVQVDSSGNAGGLTSNWGYQNGSQVVGNTLQFHATSSQSPSLSANSGGPDDPQMGLELVYQRVLGNLPCGSSTRWGVEAGFGYTDIDLRDNRSQNGVTTVTTDAYQLNGVSPPSAGYQGPYSGPGALLGDTPTRTTSAYSTTQSSQQRLSGQLYTIRIGPFAEWNFTEKWSFAASVGLTLAPASIAYDFTESTSSGSISGHSSKTDLLYGPYVGGTLRYDFTKHLGVYVGAQFESLNDLQQSVGTHTGRLDPGSLVYGTLGLTCSF